MFAFLNNIGPTEIVIFLIIIFVFFGARAMTGFARTSGETVKEIKKVKKNFTEALEEGKESKKS